MPARSQLRAPVLVVGVFVLLLAAGVSPLAAYTVFLKDGSRLVVASEYTIRGDKAILTLESGAETMLPLSEVDIERTKRANVDNIGTAIVIEGGEARDLGRNTAPPPKKATLQDLIKSRGDEALPEVEPVRRAERSDAGSTRRAAPTSRTSLRNVDLAESIRRFLFGRGVHTVEVLQGSSARRPLLSYSTATEGQVFKALTASANALLHARSEHPGEIEGFDVECRSPTHGSGGRFQMTTQMAEDLVSGRIDLPTFYVKYVIF